MSSIRIQRAKGQHRPTGYGGITNHHPAISDSSGFTLIELLVVISILGLLMAILLPMLGRVRLAARNAKCQSNLRQCGLAFWATETDGSRGQWEMAGTRLYQTQDPLLCPLATKVLWGTWEQALVGSSAACGRGATFAA
jgi:prepilin-type N-terminal cleavage/methylation domain-containing protein